MTEYFNGQLPALIQGEAFQLQVIGPTGSNLITTPVTLYLDPPLGSTASRIILKQSDPGNTVATDGSSVTFFKDPSWSTSLASGAWDLWVAVGDTINRDEWAYFVMEVVTPRSGPLA